MKPQAYLVLSGVLVFWLVGGTVCRAENSPHGGQGYVFAAPGGIVNSEGAAATLHFGGGGEAFLSHGLAVGGELGYLTPAKDLKAGFGLLSVDGSYHFRRNQRLVPFLSGGYSLGVRHGVANFVNYGGGVNYWIGNRIGLRLEVRDHIDPCAECGMVHFVTARVGLSFR